MAWVPAEGPDGGDPEQGGEGEQHEHARDGGDGRRGESALVGWSLPGDADEFGQRPAPGGPHPPGDLVERDERGPDPSTEQPGEQWQRHRGGGLAGARECGCEGRSTSTFVGLLLPAVVISRTVDGPDGLRALRRRTFRADLPARWYALAVIGVPAMIVAVAVATAGIRPTGSGLVSTVGVGFVVQLIVVLVTVNWWEEVAWMGFVQARLQARHGAMRAAALTGAAFAAGHISLVLGDGPSATITLVALLLAVTIPFRALAAWIYNRTGSLLLVGMTHAAANAVAVGSILGAGLLPRLYGDDNSSGLAFPVLAVIGLAVIVATRARLGHQPPRQLHPPPHPSEMPREPGTHDALAR